MASVLATHRFRITCRCNTCIIEVGGQERSPRAIMYKPNLPLDIWVVTAPVVEVIIEAALIPAVLNQSR